MSYVLNGINVNNILVAASYLDIVMIKFFASTYENDFMNPQIIKLRFCNFF